MSPELTPLFGAIAHAHARDKAPKIHALHQYYANASSDRRQSLPVLAPEPTRLLLPPGLPNGAFCIPWESYFGAGVITELSGLRWRAWARTSLFSSRSYHATKGAASKWCAAVVAQFHEWEALDRPWASGKALVEYWEAGGDLMAAAKGEQQEILAGRACSFAEAVRREPIMH
jgi:hypothetical protein